MKKKVCEICGKEVISLHAIEIDKSILEVCTECSKYGKPTVISTPIDIAARLKNKIKIEKDIFDEIEKENEILLDYGKIIMNARVKLGLTPKQLSEKINEKKSLIIKLESEKIIPTIELAKKIEKVLNVKILKK